MTATTFDRAPLWIYDTTLRDGAQTEGISFSVDDKLRIARRLDELGVPFIEAGWPGANPKDGKLFEQLRETPLKHAEPVAFCSTRRPGRSAATEPLLEALVAAGTRWTAVFGKSWDLQVTAALRTTLEENLNAIADTVVHLRDRDRQVVYDAEHWFDGYRANPDYAIATLQSAHQAGAQWLVLCDTNGGMLPRDVTTIVTAVRDRLGSAARLGIHTHNDSGTAVANAIAAVDAGATMVQGTIAGYGERCGNANLCTLIPNLQLKLGHRCLPDGKLETLTETSRAISELANLAPDPHAPYVGRSAFAHKGGIHVSAVLRDSQTYEHVSPAAVGNERRIVVSDQSGVGNVLDKARNFGIELTKDDPAARKILQRLKELERDGYQFEAAEASVELLMREVLGQRPQYFLMQGCQIHYDLGRNLYANDSMAAVKVTVNQCPCLEAAEGNGPVAAMDAALRRSLVQFYPILGQFQLTDYKVRILDGQAGTSAKTRVLVESSDGHGRWTTVGVSTNILEASYRALVESLEYGLMRHQVPPARSSVLPSIAVEV